jgi:L-ascorbate 6-phosphate lactonase
MSSMTDRTLRAAEAPPIEPYIFTKNDPFDRSAPVHLAAPKLLNSNEFMENIRQFQIPADALAIWFLGQNGFIVKASGSPLIGIDLYLTDSCSTAFPGRRYRLDRQLPIFVEPEDLDVDVFITTHSHQDHTDPETIRRIPKNRSTRFLGPFDSIRVYEQCGIDIAQCEIIHPGETRKLDESVSVLGTFALPTDATDLNHIGLLLQFANRLTFYNTGDTAFAEILATLLPQEVDVCAICINGGFHNLSAREAASIVKHLRPRVVIPCHYDMMINNVGSPEMMRVALELAGSDASFVLMRYYEPFIYQRA